MPALHIFYWFFLGCFLPLFSGFYNISHQASPELVQHAAAAITPPSSPTIIALVHLNKPPELFTDFEQGKRTIQQLTSTFNARFDHKNAFLKKPLVYAKKSHATVFGISIADATYTDLMQRPWLYGPLCATAKINESGEVECVVNAWHAVRRGGNMGNTSCSFEWKEICKGVFSCHHSLVKHFIESEHAKQCKELQSYIQRWPTFIKSVLENGECDIQQEEAALRSQAPHFERVFYGCHFGVRALYDMAQYEISPLRAVHAVRHGSCTRFERDFLLYSDAPHDINILADRLTHKILEVTHGPQNNEVHKTKAPEALPETPKAQDTIAITSEEFAPRCARCGRYLS